jgi:hypothetical protein
MAKRPVPPHPGSAAPRRKTVESLLKWVGAVTAVLSLIFGLYQLTQLVADARERQRQIEELQAVSQSQQTTADYEGAWATLEKALKVADAGARFANLLGKLSPEQNAVRAAQEDLAMRWLQDARATKGKFSDLVDRLSPIVNRGVATADGARKADLLAHLGWGTFLRSRDGHSGLNPEPLYRQALEIDATNPYAHAYLAHWQHWKREALEEPRRHFAEAVASGRARPQVRRVQLAALKNRGFEGEADFIAAVIDMRKNDEKLEPRTLNDLFAIYALACAGRYDEQHFERLIARVPPAEQLTHYRALFYEAGETEIEEWQRPGRDACLATLLEQAGSAEDKEEALRIWQTLWQRYSAKGGVLAERARAGLQRLQPPPVRVAAPTVTKTSASGGTAGRSPQSAPPTKDARKDAAKAAAQRGG